MKECFIFGILLGFVVGYIMSGTINDCKWRNQAIFHGAAHYNSTNGNFEWNK